MKCFKIAIACAMALLMALGSFHASRACTNFLITKGASVDGSTMISYSADSHYLYGELYHWPAAVYPKGALYKVYEWDSGRYLGEIEQAMKTYNVVGNMNEHQLVIAETTFTGRSELVDTTGVVDYGTLIYVTLQRARNAREAIKTMVELVEKYGYASSGESFSIADPEEVWILELIGKGTKMRYDKKAKKMINSRRGAVWVARRIPDGYICAHANQARITTFPLANGKTSISSKQLKKIFDKRIETVYSSDVISFAREMKYFSGKDAEFSFSDTYAPVDFGGARFCEVRVWSFFRSIKQGMDSFLDYAKGWNLKHRMPLWIKPDQKVTLQQVMDGMRDHLEGTELDMTRDCGAGPHGLPYRWRPMTWKYKGKGYVNERATATQQTGFVFVSQSRSWLPNQLGGILWFGVDDAASTVFQPIYSCITEIPEPLRVGNGSLLEFSNTAQFWLFNKVANFCYLRYNLMHADLKKVQSRLEKTFQQQVKDNDSRLANLAKNDVKSFVKEATEFSAKAVETTSREWNKLFEFLLIKYIDGNVKIEKDGVFQHTEYSTRIPVKVDNPEYPDWWKEDVVNSTGDKLKER